MEVLKRHGATSRFLLRHRCTAFISPIAYFPSLLRLRFDFSGAGDGKKKKKRTPPSISLSLSRFGYLDATVRLVRLRIFIPKTSLFLNERKNVFLPLEEN